MEGRPVQTAPRRPGVRAVLVAGYLLSSLL